MHQIAGEPSCHFAPVPWSSNGETAACPGRAWLKRHLVFRALHLVACHRFSREVGHYVMSSYTEPHPDKARDQPFYRARNRSSVIVHCKTGFNGNGNRDIPHSNADRRFRQRWDDTAGVVLGQFRDSAENTRPRLGSCKPSSCLNRLTRDFTRRRETLPSGPSEPRRSSSPSTSRHGRRLANTAAPSIPSFLNRQSCRGK
jgi:hypothetical protein